MTSEYKVSFYGRIVYLMMLILFLPFSAAMLGTVIDPLPYSREPGLFMKVFMVVVGSSGVLWSVSFIRQIFRFSPRICINDYGIKYSGFYLNTFIEFEKISSFSFVTVRGGFTFIRIRFKKRQWLICKGIQLDASGLTPSHEKLEEEMRFRCYIKSGI